MMKNLSALLVVLLLGTSGVASAYPFLKGVGMSGHVTKALEAGGKDRVVRVKMLGEASAQKRSFVAYTEVSGGHRYLHGHVDATSGKVTTTRVERAE